MKKMLLLFAALLTLGVSVRADDGDVFTVDNFKYRVLSEFTQEVSLIGYETEPVGDLSIPAEVDNKGGSYFVKEIGQNAFEWCAHLTSISIPNSVTCIEWYAFRGCFGLTAVYIPVSVASIGRSAFEGCYGLSSITIPTSVTSIGVSAFEGCLCLSSITIPNSTTSIGETAFARCTSLQEIVVESGNPNYTSIDGVLYDSQISEVIAYPAGKEGAFEISSSVTSIGPGAFEGCLCLTSITIPNSITSIGEQAFDTCTGLTSITIPNSVTCVEWRAFACCYGLTSIIIPGSVTSIATSAFADCYGLTSITISSSVNRIGFGAFSGCNSLKEIIVEGDDTNYIAIDGVLYNSKITELIIYPAGKKGAFEIPSTVTDICDGAFLDCKGLTLVTIPNSVTNIGIGAFRNCEGLYSLTIPNSVVRIGTGAFWHCKNLRSVSISNAVTSIEDYVFRYCLELHSLTIPNSVTSIGEMAFSDCYNLSSITIPNLVTSIGAGAFYNCESLKIVIAQPITPPACDSSAFVDVPQTAIVHIPRGTLNDYSVADGWDYFTDFREMDDATDIENVQADSDDGFADYFNLNGVRVNGDVLAPGLYIKRQAGKASKVLVK